MPQRWMYIGDYALHGDLMDSLIEVAPMLITYTQNADKEIRVWRGVDRGWRPRDHYVLCIMTFAGAWANA